MRELKERIEHFIKKSELTEKPFKGQITDIKEDEKFKRTVLILLGTHGDKQGEFNLSINSKDEIELAKIVGSKWENYRPENIYSISSVNTGETFKDYPIFMLKIEEMVN